MRLVEEFNTKSLPKRKRAGILLIGLSSVFLVATLGEFAGYLEPAASWQYYLSALIAVVLGIVLHEGLHGLFFWIFTGKATFGVQLKSSFGPAFFTASYGSLTSRPKFQVVLLAPQILTVCLLLVLVFTTLPSIFSGAIVLMAAFNLGGGCADIYFSLWLQKYPRSFLIEDTRTGIKTYANV